MTHLRLIFGSILALASILRANPLSLADDLWIEGEKNASQQLTPHPWYSEAIKHDLLSGGHWASHFDPAQDGTVRYDLKVQSPGDYTLWIRLNPIASRLAYRLNPKSNPPSPWQDVDTQSAIDTVNIANDGKPDLRFVAWVRAGSVPLPAGNPTLEFRMHSDNHHHGAIDCFLLTQSDFEPSGTMKPGQKLGLSDPGWWAFEPDPDPFKPSAMLDLRSINEKTAGQNGFVKSDGEQFLLGNDTPVRFWGINTGHDLFSADDATIRLTARRWAKFGINLVRIHGPYFDRTSDDPMFIDPNKLRRLHHVVNALKQEGIYSHISFFFPLWMQLKPSDHIEGSAIGKHPFALPFFEPQMQAMLHGWLQQILTTPVDGQRLADEPAVACFEILNEDSLLFWTFSAENLGPGPLKTLESQFATYLTKKHGSLEKAFAHWKSEKHPRDSLADARVTLLDAWHMTRDGMKGSQDKRRRMVDQIAFLAITQRRFYGATLKYMRSLGCQSLIAASNWTTADNAILGGVERWSYLAADVIDKHGYYGTLHEGEASSYAVREGHTYEDASALLNPETVPISYWQIAGKPHLQSEIAWNKPNRFIADGNLLAASYAALQGVDGYVWFVAADGKWLNHGNSKWTWMMPGEIGQSPAAALQYRRGDVAQSSPVLTLVSSNQQVLSLQNTHLLEGRNADFRTSNLPPTASSEPLQNFDPLTPFVGRVEQSFNPKSKPNAIDVRPFIDRQAGIITSTTQELHWNFHDGLLTVNTPCSQAISGFLAKAGSTPLTDVTIDSNMEYGTIHVISLDSQPLASSQKILIQAFSEEKMYGFQANAGTIQNTGRLPINVRDIHAEIRFQKPRPFRISTLDPNGYPVDNPKPFNGKSLDLNPNALYTILTSP